MNDKQMKAAALIAGIALVAWWAMQKNGAPVTLAATPATSQALPIGWDSPMLTTYASNPAGFGPVSPSQLTVNIGNQSGNLLSDQYTPLFGFVGMAQGPGYA